MRYYTTKYNIIRKSIELVTNVRFNKINNKMNYKQTKVKTKYKLRKRINRLYPLNEKVKGYFRSDKPNNVLNHEL